MHGWVIEGEGELDGPFFWMGGLFELVSEWLNGFRYMSLSGFELGGWLGGVE